MTVLVTAASKHRSTMGIAEAIAAELRTMGYEVDVAPADGYVHVDRHDAVILGSAVYMGRWLPEATDLVVRNLPSLREKLVWLFSSGPLGWDDPIPKDDPTDAEAVLAEIGARGHQVFVGKLDKQDLGFMERLATRAVKAPEGDFRDWSAIRSWAREIGTSLAPHPTTAAEAAAFTDQA